MRTADPTTGATLWLTGLSGAGKSTLAEALAEELSEHGNSVEVLDGDDLRTNLSADLGFSAHDRDVHVRRVGFVAELLARHGVIVLVPVIAPHAPSRTAVRQHHRDRGRTFLEIHVATPAAECIRRDPKGLYAKAASGHLSGLTGFDAAYEVPDKPELRLDTTDLNVATAREAMHKLLEQHGVTWESAQAPAFRPE